MVQVSISDAIEVETLKHKKINKKFVFYIDLVILFAREHTPYVNVLINKHQHIYIRLLRYEYLVVVRNINFIILKINKIEKK